MDQKQIYRVLDANCNRLREAFRIIEEYFRFIQNNELISVSLKQMRHSLIDLETTLGHSALLDARETETDCFASKNRPEEMVRSNGKDIVIAGFKRAQEAARVIEEYIKVTQAASWSEQAKTIRFTLYNLEKQLLTL
jgi:thiamine-phosphate pyrophosphorylase